MSKYSKIKFVDSMIPIIKDFSYVNKKNMIRNHTLTLKYLRRYFPRNMHIFNIKLTHEQDIKCCNHYNDMYYYLS